MAEAIVEPPSAQRFYCHICTVEVQSVNADFTCPICSGGFIEELPVASASDQSSDDVEMMDASRMEDIITDEIATFLMVGRPPDSSLDEDSTNTIVANNTIGSNPSNNVAGVSTNRGGIGGAVGMTRRNHRHNRLQNLDRFDNVIFEILQTLSGGNDASLGNASMLFMGNPGDYAWGREGIDSIVTQLLNQMDTTGPPPLPKDKINEIPIVEICEEQVDQKLQCSVCWEDFKAMESVRKLPCLHFYHESCIVPWLELHGTCPICRKSLTPENTDVSSSLRNAVYNRNSSDGNRVDTVNNLPATTSSSSSSSSTDTFSTGLFNSSTSLSNQSLRQMPSADPANIFNSFPMTFSRIFSPQAVGSSQPSTFSIAQNLRPPAQQTTTSATITAPLISQQQQQQQSNNTRNGSIGESRNNPSSQTDVYRFDDGNVEYEFD